MLDFTRLDKVRRQRPLIHCVSNIVTANDCANLALAVGASPMMAQAPEEMEAISAVSDATVLNTGTPDAEKFRACRICAVSARHPVVLDPVGVGASPWRLGQVRALLDLFTPSILRVNLGEARALLGSDGQEQGVDSPLPASREARRDTAMDLARRRGTAVLLSGPEDLITDGARVWCVTGGSGRMSLVTGTGCMLSVLCGVFAAVEPDAAAAASGSTAANTPHSTDSIQPVPVTRDIRPLPPVTHQTRAPSVMRSSGPESSTAVPRRRARSMAVSLRASRLAGSGLSTPCSCPSDPSRARASPRFTRRMDGVNRSSSARTCPSRQGLAPTPTGSSTTG